CHGYRLLFPSFPTRRSSDLDFPGIEDLAAQRHDRLELLVPRLLGTAAGRVTLHQEQLRATAILPGAVSQLARQRRPLGDAFALRSEEHTSELQSRENLVCRL